MRGKKREVIDAFWALIESILPRACLKATADQPQCHHSPVARANRHERTSLNQLSRIRCVSRASYAANSMALLWIRSVEKIEVAFRRIAGRCPGRRYAGRGCACSRSDAQQRELMAPAHTQMQARSRLRRRRSRRPRPSSRSRASQRRLRLTQPPTRVGVCKCMRKQENFH